MVTRPKASPWILVALGLLASQAPAFLHAALHPDGGLDSQCEFCLDGSGHGAGALPPDAGFAVAAPTAAGTMPAPTATVASRPVAIPRVRGPPLPA